MVAFLLPKIFVLSQFSQKLVPFLQFEISFVFHVEQFDAWPHRWQKSDWTTLQFKSERVDYKNGPDSVAQW